MAFAWLLATMLSGCQGNASRAGYYTSPLLPGDQVEILRELKVPAEQARIYLQHGATNSYGGIDQYAPFCYFLLRDPLPAEQTIQPGVWDVERAWLTQTTSIADLPLNLAGAGGLGGGDFPLMAWQFHITLKGAAPPLMTLVCSGAFDSPSMADPIRLAEVREAFGDYAAVSVRETPSNR